MEVEIEKIGILRNAVHIAPDQNLRDDEPALSRRRRRRCRGLRRLRAAVARANAQAAHDRLRALDAVRAGVRRGRSAAISRAAGFNATLSPIVAGQDAMALVAQGQMDVATAGLSAAFFNAVNRGLDVKFVASTGYQPATGHPTALMMRQDLYDAGAHDAEALRGKTHRLARQRRRDRGLLRRADLAQVPADDEGHPGRQRRRARPRSRARAQSRRRDLLLRRRSPRCSPKRSWPQIVGTVPPGVAGTGIFFGPSLLDERGRRQRLYCGAFRRGAADVAGSGYLPPENLAAMSKYVGQPVDLIKTTDRYDFKPDLRIDQATLTRHAERIHPARHPDVQARPCPMSNLIREGTSTRTVGP